MSRLRFPDYIRSRAQALEYACEKGGANPDKGRGYLRLVLEGDIAQNTKFALPAQALLAVADLIGNDQVTVWDFTTWDPQKGLGVENFDVAAARLLAAVAATGDIAKALRAGRELDPLVDETQVTRAIVEASRVLATKTTLPAAAPAEATMAEPVRATG